MLTPGARLLRKIEACTCRACTKEVNLALTAAKREGRNEGMEEAAKAAEQIYPSEGYGDRIAAAIRARIKEMDND